MRKLRLVLLVTMLLIILTSMGCGTRTSSNTNTQSAETAQTQSNVKDAQSESKDPTQTQNNAKDTQTENKDTAQTQTSPKDTQLENKNSAQTQSNANTQAPTKSTAPIPKQAENNPSTPAVKSNPLVTITMASEEQIKLELYPNVAPNTVKSFIFLVQKGFYNGLSFHRVIPGFMIQGGDPKGNGTGGPGYSIKGEFTNNGFKNDLKHERGVLSMGRTPDPNSAGSQFFIMAATVPSLDKEYAAFGKVISGMEVVDKIVNSPRDKADKPLQNQVMKSVTVDTFGEKFAEPEVIKK